jgi:hypothetical protein
MPFAATLVPTEGCYQKPKPCTVFAHSATLWYTKVDGETKVRTFRKSTLLHHSPSDREFPNYKLVIPEGTQLP